MSPFVARLPLDKLSLVSVLVALAQMSVTSELKPLNVLPEYPQTADATSVVEGVICCKAAPNEPGVV